MCNHTSRHAWKMCYFNIKIFRQFFMVSMEPCMVQRMVAHFGRPGHRNCDFVRFQNFNKLQGLNVPITKELSNRKHNFTKKMVKCRYTKQFSDMNSANNSKNEIFVFLLKNLFCHMTI